MLLWDYEEGRLLWEAKGWGVTKVAEHLTSKPELLDFDVSQSSLSRKSTYGRRVEIEPEVALAIEGLETQNWHQRRTQIVEAGLRALHGQSPEVNARELALALLAHLPTNELALKLSDAVLAHAGLIAGPGLLDTVAGAIADRLRATKLAAELGQHLESASRLGAKRLALVAGMATLVTCGVWFLLGAVFPVRASTTPPVVIVANLGTGNSPLVFQPHLLLGALEEQMGQKPPERLIPEKPLPGQKLAPDCKASLGEREINGGCWGGMIDVKPPCGELFRHGDVCYRPIAADPQKPVGLTPEGPAKEPR